MSYLLAGNAPIYSGEVNDDLLHARLCQMPSYPITLQDLKELSEVRIFKILCFCGKHLAVKIPINPKATHNKAFLQLKILPKIMF